MPSDSFASQGYQLSSMDSGMQSREQIDIVPHSSSPITNLASTSAAAHNKVPSVSVDHDVVVAETLVIQPIASVGKGTSNWL
jgi:hypothetical protein